MQFRQYSKNRETTKGLTLLAVAVMLTASAVALAADESEDDGKSPSMFGFGAGAGIERKPYRGVGTKVDALPVISYENRWIRLLGPNLDFKLTPPGPLTIGARINYEFDSGYKASDSSVLKGMVERKSGLWVGPGAAWHNGFIDLTATYLLDASGESKGTRATLSAEHSFGFGNVELVPIVSITELDHKYVDYYYGVRPTEATSTRFAYSGKRTTNLDGALRVRYLFAERHLLFVQVGLTRLGSAVKDSPLVDRSSEPHALLGYIYRFW
jgi:outer membrane scaffolding protein for murein synthesis (MipA/OmpV family)